MRYISFVVAILLLSTTGFGAAAPTDDGGAQAAGQATAISKNVDEVSVDLAAYNHDKPVLDLAPQDLRLTDAGVPVAISSLRLVRRDAELKMITLLFDRVDSVGRANALKLTSKILQSLPPSGFAVTVFSIRGQLRLHQEFTSDATLVARAAVEATQDKTAANPDARINDLIAAAKRGRDASGKLIPADHRVRAQVLLTALQDAQYILHDQHPNSSLAALLALVGSERRLPGQKAIFFVTQDPTSDAKDGPTLVSIVSAANASGVKIFAIDANASNYVSKEYLQAFSAIKSTMSLSTNTGITPMVSQQAGQQTTAPAGPASVTPGAAPLGALGDVTRVAGMTDFDKRRYDSLEVQDKRESAWVCRLARNTGGACLRPEENPRDMMRQALDDMSTYYEATFVPAAKQYDGKFHDIKLKPLRRGLKLRSRPGYVALPPESNSEAHPFEAPLLKILSEKTLPHELEFVSRVLELGHWEEGQTAAVAVEIPIAQLETRDDPNAHLYSSQVSVLIQIKDNSGQVMQYFADDVSQHGALEEKQAGTAESVRLQRYFTVDPGEYDLEVAVLDRNSGKAAGQRSRLRVADAARSPFLSDVSVVARMEPLPAGNSGSEPLRYGDARVVLDASGQVPRNRKQVPIFSIVHLDPKANEQPQLALKLSRNGQPLARVPLQLRANEQTAAYVATIQTTSLPAGAYEVVETLTQGGRVAERSAAFQIAGPDVAPSAAAASTAVPQAIDAPEDNASSANPLTTAIAEMPSAALLRPSAEAFQAMISAATRYALRYSESLPNFICTEVTKRSVDSSGRGDWNARDSFTHLLRYDGTQETRTWLESNGHQPDAKSSDPSTDWPTSVGQFGGLLRLVFSPASKTSFEWKSVATLGSETVQVLSYVVSAEHATMGLNGNGRRIGVGFHGLLYVDPATGGIRRIALEADGIPRDFAFRSTAMIVNYDYVNIGGSEYLLPMDASVTVQRGSRRTEMNEIAFRNYSRFAAKSKIIVPPR